MDFRHLGEAIRSARLARGWTQEKLGRLIYRSQARVSEIEAGAVPATIEDLVRIGDVLDSHAVDCALAAAVTNGRMGLVAPVAGGAAGAMMALEHEVRDLLVKMERIRLSFCLVAERPCLETINALRQEVRDCTVLCNTMEVQCELLAPTSARQLAKEYEESRPHYAATKQNRPWQRAVA